DYGGPKRRVKWKRKATVIPKLSVPGKDGEPTVVHSQDGIDICVGQRRLGLVRVVTVSVVNKRKEPDRTVPRDLEKLPEDRAIYQVQIRAYSWSGEEVFVARPAGIYISDPEFV